MSIRDRFDQQDEDVHHRKPVIGTIGATLLMIQLLFEISFYGFDQISFSWLNIVLWLFLTLYVFKSYNYPLHRLKEICSFNGAILLTILSRIAKFAIKLICRCSIKQCNGQSRFLLQIRERNILYSTITRSIMSCSYKDRNIINNISNNKCIRSTILLRYVCLYVCTYVIDYFIGYLLKNFEQP